MLIKLIPKYCNADTVPALGNVARQLPDRAILALIQLLQFLSEAIALEREEKNKIDLDLSIQLETLLDSLICQKLHKTFGFEKFSGLMVRDTKRVIAILLLGLSDISAFKPMVGTRKTGKKRPQVNPPTSTENNGKGLSVGEELPPAYTEKKQTAYTGKEHLKDPPAYETEDKHGLFSNLK